MYSRINLFFTCFLLISLIAPAQNVNDTLIIFYFSVNSNQLDSVQRSKLAELTPQIAKIDAIAGYTDTTGSFNYNKHLSRLRAYEIFKAMKKMNFLLIADPLGKGEVFDNPDLSKNRKVEVFASLKPKSISENKRLVNDSVINVLSIDNIYFIPDKPEIEASSYQQVQELASTLKKYEGVSFEIIGHVNYQSKRDSSHISDLYRLSELRAKRIYELLISEGISSAKMSHKGVGNSQPLIAHPKNDEERKKNMRVEIKIVM